LKGTARVQASRELAGEYEKSNEFEAFQDIPVSTV